MIPIYATLFAAPAVTALLGSGPMRVYRFGDAPLKVAKPYVMWGIIGGAPENYLGEAPDIDDYSLQVDVYASTGASADAVAKAVRDAIQPRAHITSWLGHSYEPDTKLYRFNFSVDWLVPRA